jgi:16S rRNA (guanine(966)-N(2))-methyltransferase RsmD
MGTRRRKTPAGRPSHREQQPAAQPVGVRIIGGTFRGRKLEYSGDPRTRPMKDRLRESLFNRLGSAVKGKLAIDLFAGTGALGLEALSRGAARAVFIEQHIPTARAIRRSVETLGAAAVVEIVAANTFLWFRRRPNLGPEPWLVFCSPPYDFYVDRAEEVLALLGGMIEAAPHESVFAVESDARFDFQRLPDPEAWDVRASPPAVVGIYEKR